MFEMILIKMHCFQYVCSYFNIKTLKAKLINEKQNGLD